MDNLCSCPLKSNGEFVLIFDLVIWHLVFKIKVEYTLARDTACFSMILTSPRGLDCQAPFTG
jgi:hypothetical protein